MNRSHRVALTAAAASALIAGGAGAVTFGPLDFSSVATAPVPGPGSDAQPRGASAAADPTELHAAVSRLAGAATALQREISAARHRLDGAGLGAGLGARAAARGPAAIPRDAAPPSARARQLRRPAPAVHSRTGASSSIGRGRSEAEDD